MSVVELAKAKTHLNITVDAHDTELQDFIDRAEAAIGRRTGPLSATPTTARVRGGGDALALPVCPAASLTSVTPLDGDALTLADLHLDEDAALVTFESGGTFSARRYDVVYDAGRDECPDDLKLAVLEMVRHLWDTQRGPARRPGSTASDSTANTVPGAAYVFPYRVEQLIAPHEQPGFA